MEQSDQADKPEPFAAVISELIDRDGQMVAAQARAIVGDDEADTWPELANGVFEAMPGALECPRVAIIEAPIDALTLAAVGLPAIALCGASWPEWLPEYLAGREVVLGTDARHRRRQNSGGTGQADARQVADDPLPACRRQRLERDR